MNIYMNQKREFAIETKSRCSQSTGRYAVLARNMVETKWKSYPYSGEYCSNSLQAAFEVAQQSLEALGSKGAKLQSFANTVDGYVFLFSMDYR